MRGSRPGLYAAPLACLALLLPSLSSAQDPEADVAPQADPGPDDPSEDQSPPVVTGPTAGPEVADASSAPTGSKPGKRKTGFVGATDDLPSNDIAFDPSLAATPGAPGARERAAQPVPWLVPNIQIQTWFTAYDQYEDLQSDPATYGDPNHRVGFNVPRGRMGFSGGWGITDFALRFGSLSPYDALDPRNSRSIQIVDAWGRVSIPSAGGTTRIMVGHMPIAYSRETMMSSNDLVFQEIGVSSAWLSPVYDVGLAASHVWKWLALSAGLYNGNGDVWGDDDPGLMFTGRLDITAGGDGFRTNDTRDTVAFGAAYRYNRRFSSTEQAVNVDFLGRVKGLSLLVEGGMVFLNPDEDPIFLPPGVPEVTRQMGGLIQLSYYADLPIGSIEPAIRISTYDDATHLRDNGDVAILHSGLNWREPVPFVDVGAAYIHRMELHGRQIDNDSFRVFFGVRYPSRRYRPLDLVNLFRKAGTKPLDPPESL